MTPPSTLFRKAVAEHLSTVTGIGLVVHGEREGRATDGGDLIAVWTTAGATNDENAQFRAYGVTARILFAWDAQRTPDEDDPLDELEALEANVLAATPPFLGDARVVSVDSTFYPSDAAIDFTFLGEVQNAESEV